MMHRHSVGVCPRSSECTHASQYCCTLPHIQVGHTSQVLHSLHPAVVWLGSGQQWRCGRGCHACIPYKTARGKMQLPVSGNLLLRSPLLSIATLKASNVECWWCCPSTRSSHADPSPWGGHPPFFDLYWITGSLAVWKDVDFKASSNYPVCPTRRGDWVRSHSCCRTCYPRWKYM